MKAAHMRIGKNMSLGRGEREQGSMREGEGEGKRKVGYYKGFIKT